MKEDEQLKINRIIAIFDGYVRIPDDEYVLFEKDGGGPKVITALDFDRDWNELIRVYGKLNTLIWDDKGLTLDDCVRNLMSAFTLRVSCNAPGEASQILVKLIQWYESK